MTKNSVFINDLFWFLTNAFIPKPALGMERSISISGEPSFTRLDAKITEFNMNESNELSFRLRVNGKGIDDIGTQMEEYLDCVYSNIPVYLNTAKAKWSFRSFEDESEAKNNTTWSIKINEYSRKVNLSNGDIDPERTFSYKNVIFNYKKLVHIDEYTENKIQYQMFIQIILLQDITYLADVDTSSWND